MTWVRDFLAVIDPKYANFADKEIPEAFVPALRDGPFEVFADLGVELRRLLHVSQEYDYQKPMLAQKWIEHETEIADLKEKSSKLGSIYIMDLRTRFTQDGEPCFESLMRVFVRRG